jgi:hypothetical protein
MSAIKDPVQFVMSNNNEVKRLVEDLGNSEDESQSEDIRNEMRESISSNLSMRIFFASSSIPLACMFSLRFAVSGEQLFVVTQLV